VSNSARISKLERAIRKEAREKYTAGVLADFEPAIARANGDAPAAKLLFDARNAVIKSGTKDAEEAALAAFLQAKDPVQQPIDLDALRNPAAVLIAANGERLPDTSKDAVAVLLPQFGLLYTIETWAANSWQRALEIGAAVELFEGKGEWQLWDDVEAGLTIDRRAHGPAVIPAFRGCTPTNDWYWTRTPHASSSVSALYVNLSYGYVSWNSRDGSGRVRAVRRVRASQF
jgi:hypothetical protein